MKGRELSIEEVLKLEDGTKVWVEYDQSKWNFKVIDNVETKRYEATYQENESYSYIKNSEKFNTKYYEWLEEAEGTPKQTSQNTWIGKKYEIRYFRGITHKMGMTEGKGLVAKGTLINIDSPFTGRFFIENDNGALEIIYIGSVVEMREIV